MPSSIPSDTTLVIKTFERPECLSRIIRSIRIYYPTTQVLIADDSRKPVAINNACTRTYAMPYDSGLSAGRNLLLSKVATDYFVLLDDDFIFTDATILETLQSYIASGYDLVAGSVNDTRHIPFHIGEIISINGIGSVKIIQAPDKPIVDCSFVPNFFMARTTAIRPIGWTERLKLAEHMDFFIRAYGRLKIGYCRGVSVLHDREPRSLFYRRMRSRTVDFQKPTIQPYTLVRSTRRPFLGRR